MGQNKYAMSCRNVNHWFGDGNARKNVLFEIHFDVLEGEIVSLVGPSGCGKSTLLRAIVGTHPPRAGSVCIYTAEGVECTVDDPSRKIGIVYQKYSLFPFLTAVQNVALGLMLDDASLPFRLLRPFAWRRLRREHLEESAELLKKLGLGNAINQYPAALSGGMQQRVAIAQALIMKPEILLLDEPFGALDEATRGELQQMLLGLYCENVQAKRDGKRPPYTIVLVTHELKEALYVGDRVLGLSQYWNWAGKGHEAFPGATIVYDEIAPVFVPNSPGDIALLEDQRARIISAVFDPKAIQAAVQFRRFWQQVAAGEGKGVLDVQGA